MAKAVVVNEDEWDDKAYLRFLPPHLQDRYREAVTDPQLTHLARQIALIDVRIKTLLECLDRQPLTIEEIEADALADFPHLRDLEIKKIAQFTFNYLPDTFIDHRTFKRFEKILTNMEVAQRDGRIRDADRAKKQLFEGIRSGRREGDVWNDINEAMEERRKLSETEERRLSDNKQSLAIDQVVLLTGMLIKALRESVVKYVTDTEIRQYILENTEQIYRRQLGMGSDR